jgi:hypothetical protein
MASTETNLITRINSSGSKILVNNSFLSRFTLSVNSVATAKTITQAPKTNTINLGTPYTEYIPTPLKDVSRFGFFDMLDYITYLKKYGIDQTISLNTDAKITGVYDSKSVSLDMNLVYTSHPYLFFNINFKNFLNVYDSIINSSIEAQVSGYVLGKKIDDLPQPKITGQSNLKGILSIKINGTVTSNSINATISGTFSGDFTGTINGNIQSNTGTINGNIQSNTGTINGNIQSNSGTIDQLILIQISHTNYIL